MEGIRMDPFAKIMLAGISILVFGLIFVTLYGQWTAYGYDKILGVQGRYFLPLLLPVVLALKPKRFAEGTNGTPWGLVSGMPGVSICVYMLHFLYRLSVSINKQITCFDYKVNSNSYRNLSIMIGRKSLTV